MNDDLKSYIEPELEARIVALVLGEASAFEEGELEKMISARPELQAYRERIEKVHGVVSEAHREVDEEEWKLSDERREAVLSRFRETAQTEVIEERRERGSRRAQRNLIYACAACLLLTLILGGMLFPMGKTKEMGLQSYSVEKEVKSPEAMLAELNDEFVDQNEKVERLRKDFAEVVQEQAIPYFDNRHADTVDLSLRQHTYTQAKETYEQSRAMLREMKIKQNETRATLGLPLIEEEEGKMEGLNARASLAKLGEAMPATGAFGVEKFDASQEIDALKDAPIEGVVSKGLAKVEIPSSERFFDRKKSLFDDFNTDIAGADSAKADATPMPAIPSFSLAPEPSAPARPAGDKLDAEFGSKDWEVGNENRHEGLEPARLAQNGKRRSKSQSENSQAYGYADTDGDWGIELSDQSKFWGGGTSSGGAFGEWRAEAGELDFAEKSIELAREPRARNLTKSKRRDGDLGFAKKASETEVEGRWDLDEGVPFSSSLEAERELSKSDGTIAKLNETILPELKLENASLEDALALIEEKVNESQPNLESKFLFGLRESRELDGGGLDLESPGGLSETKIRNLDLKNVPADVALQYIADAAKVRYRVEENGKVTLLPIGDGAEADIVQRRWVVPSDFTSFIDTSGGGGADDPFAVEGDERKSGILPREDITTLLKKNGISFPPNTTASLSAEDNVLIVRNTPTNLDLIEGIVKASGPALQEMKEEEEQLKRGALALKKERENFEISTSVKSDSTFSLNVSDVSFKLAKAALAEGNWPDAAKVRAEEFVNALDYDDQKPSQSEKVASVIEQGAHPFMPQRNLMRVAMSTASLGRNASTPLRLTILLDQSGSMERADRAESVKRAFALLAAQLTKNDEVTLIGFARTPRLLAERMKGDEAKTLTEIVANPLTEGGTNLEAALTSGLQMARQQFLAEAQNRIILVTDGAANLGDALPENLSRQVASMRKLGIAFDACGVGADGLNDEVLSSLAKQGDGRYYFLDRPEDADAGFAKQIAGALRPAAKNVKVQILFNPERVSKFKLYGFEKHKLKKQDFRNDAVDAAEMAAEESGVALYHFEAIPDGEGDVGTVSVRFLDTVSGEMVERTWGIPYEPEVALFSEAKESLRLAATAALFAERLKASPVGERVELKKLRQEMELLTPTFDLQPRFHELKNMLQQAGD